MIKYKEIWSNLFDKPSITPVRLLEFGWAVHTALTSANNNGQYTATLAKLLAALTALQDDLGDIEQNVSKQKNSTIGVNAYMLQFATFMVDNEYVIAKPLGGRDTDGYRISYPFGKTEYSLVNKTTMPALARRVQKAAYTYATELGSEMATQLQGFAPGYTNAVNTQRLRKREVKTELSSKSQAFVQAQWALTGAVHTVAVVNGENAGSSAAMFPFEMLFTQPKHKRLLIEEVVAKSETKTVLNLTLNANASLRVRNTSKNARIIVWLAANITDAAPADAIIVNADKKRIIKAPKLGDLKMKTFLMIKNKSDVNESSLKMEISGLTTQQSDDESDKKEMKVVRA